MFKRRKVDEMFIRDILYQFVNGISTTITMIIQYKISKRGIVNLYTNRPGILIGRNGEDINAIRNEMKTKANAKDVKVFEMKDFVINKED